MPKLRSAVKKEKTSEEADESVMVKEEKASEDMEEDKDNDKKQVMRYPKLHAAVTPPPPPPTPPVELQFECEEISREVGKGKENGQWLLGRRLSFEEVGDGH